MPASFVVFGKMRGNVPPVVNQIAAPPQAPGASLYQITGNQSLRQKDYPLGRRCLRDRYLFLNPVSQFDDPFTAAFRRESFFPLLGHHGAERKQNQSRGFGLYVVASGFGIAVGTVRMACIGSKTYPPWQRIVGVAQKP